MATQSTSEGHDGTTTVAVPAVTCASSCPRSSCFCECSMRVVECMCASTRRLPNVRQKRTSTSSARWHRSERQARWRWAERRIWVCRRAQAVSTGDASAGDASARANASVGTGLAWNVAWTLCWTYPYFAWTLCCMDPLSAVPAFPRALEQIAFVAVGVAHDARARLDGIV
jgi:hypothetical protein